MKCDAKYCGRIVVLKKSVLRVEYAELGSARLHVSTSVRISTTVFINQVILITISNRGVEL